VIKNITHSISDSDELSLIPSISNILILTDGGTGGGFFSVFSGDKYPPIHNPEITEADTIIAMTITDAAILERFMSYPSGWVE
jgi:hypothetical protein